MKYLNSIIIATCLATSLFANARKPGPFSDVDFVTQDQKHRLVSTMRDKAGLTEKGITKVFRNKKKLLWSMPIFIGRHDINLSDDGKILVLLGNFYFRESMQLDKNEVVATVYQNGMLAKKVYFIDLFSEDPDKMAADRKLFVISAGWVKRRDFIKDTKIDWSKRTLAFTTFDGQVKTVGY